MKVWKPWYKVLFVAAMAAVGGALSRMAGGGLFKLPLGLDQWLYALPYAAVYFVLPDGWQWYWAALGALLSYAGAFLGKRTGHGQYIHLKWGKLNPAEFERLDFIVKLVFGPDKGGQYWRSVFGLAVTGLACTLLAGVCFAVSGAWAGAALVWAGGAAKGLAYMMGWAVYAIAVKLGLIKDRYAPDSGWQPGMPKTPLETFFTPTAWGETLTGVFGWGSLAAAFAI